MRSLCLRGEPIKNPYLENQIGVCTAGRSFLDVILLNLYEDGEQSIGVLMEWVTECKRTRFRKNYLNPLMECNLVAFTIPEKPTGSKQEYKLTKKGVDLVESAVATVDEFYKEQGWNK